MKLRVLFGSILLALLSLSLLMSCGDDEEAPAAPFNIAIGNNFPPYDVSALNGLNHDILTAICAANTDMSCNIQDAAYDECFDTDTEGNSILGTGLTAGTYDGCMGWFVTQARVNLGISFSDDYALGLPTSLIMASGGTAPSGTDLGGATVGFFSGFFNDDDCLDRYYDNFTAEFYGGETPRDDLLAALADGTIDYIFWDAAPPQDPPSGTEYVGNPIGDCPDAGLAMAALGSRAAELVSAFNAGLATIQSNGTLEQICSESNSKYGYGDPGCILTSQ